MQKGVGDENGLCGGPVASGRLTGPIVYSGSMGKKHMPDLYQCIV